MKTRPDSKWKLWTQRGFLLSVLILAAASQATAAIYTVCASGCTFNNANSNGNPVQAAIDAASPGDVIEIRAGETFSTRIVLPTKKGTRYVTVRSSRWRDLPLPGYRVNPEDHGALMPSLQAFGATEPVLRVGLGERQVAAVNPLTDVMTIPAHGWPTNTAVSCRTEEASILPDSIETNVIYRVLNTGSDTIQLSATEGGAPLDIKSGLYTPNTFCTEANPAHHYRFIGIDFHTKPGMETQYSLVEVGSGEESAIAGVPHHIEFERCLFRGFPNESGPRNLIAMNGASLRVEDSWLGHAKQDANESHAIVMYNTPGPVVIRNNYINGASINILTGGARAAIRGLSTTDLTIEGNLIEKLPYQLYNSGSGAPSGSCLTGRYYRNTNVSSTSCADGGCYTCQDSRWVQDLTAPYRSTHYLTKALLEFKHCLRCRVEGNVIRNGFEGPDTGNPGYCILLSVVGDVRAVNKDILFRNNRCDNVWSGFGVSASTPADQITRSGPVRIENNVVTGMGKWPDFSTFSPEGSGAHRRATFYSTGYDNVATKNNTIRAAGEVSFGILFATPAGGPSSGFTFENNILPQGIHVDGALNNTCGPGGMGLYVANSPGLMKNSVLYGASNNITWSCSFQNLGLPPSVAFVSATDNRLSPGSPYSASCTSGCSFTGTDGKDLGADLPVLEEKTSGSLAGTPKWSQQAQLKIVEGSTRALVSYVAPDDVSCTVELFENAAMTLPYMDTSNAESQVDNRTGSVFDGRRRRFVLGTQIPLVANTRYYGRVRCGDRTMPFQLRTRQAGSETVRFGIQLQDAEAHNAVVEYDTNPAMTSPQVTAPVSFSNGLVNLSVPVTPGSVVYARWKKRNQSNTALTTGPVEVYVNP